MLGCLPTVYPGCLLALWLLANCFRAACLFYCLLLVRWFVLFVSACYELCVLYSVNLVAGHCPCSRLLRLFVSVCVLLLQCFWCCCLSVHVSVFRYDRSLPQATCQHCHVLSLATAPARSAYSPANRDYFFCVLHVCAL